MSISYLRQMTTFDVLFFHFFNHYKSKKSKKAIKIATFYVTVLQISLVLLLGVFFAGFFSQMHVNMMSSGKAWTLFVLLAILISFNNWMQYSGKKRNVIGAKMTKRKKLDYNIWFLWSIPFIILGLCYVLSMAT